MGEADALARLEAFVGEWDLEASFPSLPDADVRARTVFEWVLDRKFLLQRAEISIPEAPNGLMVIAPVAGGDGYTQHYFDSRGVVRTYAMTFDGRIWTLTRETPDFSPLDFAQQYTGTFEDDGATIRGGWKICHDGETWEHDFDLTYRKVA
jgi:hypothetical protein